MKKYGKGIAMIICLCSLSHKLQGCGLFESALRSTTTHSLLQGGFHISLEFVFQCLMSDTDLNLSFWNRKKKKNCPSPKVTDLHGKSPVKLLNQKKS